MIPTPASPAPLQAEFVRQVEFYLDDSLLKVEQVWASLSEVEIWQRPNAQCLAPANQLLHLTGNLRQWVGEKLGGQPPIRMRDAEFAAQHGPNKAQLWAEFAAVTAFAKTRLHQATDLLRPVTVQGHQTTELGVWLHMTEHLSYHTGQLVFFAKQLSSKSFDFYADWDLYEEG